GLLLDADRNREAERRPLALGRFEPDSAAVHLHDALRDREAQAGPAFRAGRRSVSLLELLEDASSILFADAGARVGDRDEEGGIFLLSPTLPSALRSPKALRAVSDHQGGRSACLPRQGRGGQ